ncbi:MAG: hypothetical protein EA356_15655 [Geminicoccaceae bacterium]|nr:MAG: hypothetical protein EA356_15655 [Geminicoccaceae bacterium]
MVVAARRMGKGRGDLMVPPSTPQAPADAAAAFAGKVAAATPLSGGPRGPKAPLPFSLFPCVRWLLTFLLLLAFTAPATASERARALDARVDLALAELRATVPGATDLLDRARGVLVMPRVLRGGFIVGATTGEGALRVDGRTVDFYTIAGASIGFQAGGEVSRHALLFMTDEALADFRAGAGSGWEVGASASVTMFTLGAEDRMRLGGPDPEIIGIVFGQRGLMGGVSLDGSRYTRVER